MKYENIKTGDIIDIPYKIKDDIFKLVEPKKPAPKKEPRKTKE